MNIISAQENYFTTHDLNSLSQRNTNIVEIGGETYALGVTICNSGECGILSKYSEAGELMFLNEIDNIDVNSPRCFGLSNDTLMVVALSKYDVGARLQMYDLEGNLLKDELIKRDENLVYTWPLDILYKEDYILMAVNENYENEPRQTAVYKVDYEGSVLDYIRLPYHFRGGILTLTTLQNGNLFVTQPYNDESLCAFEQEDVDYLNAMIFYEVTLDSLEIIREKENMCYQSTIPVGYDCTVLSNNNIVRNILWRDSLNENIIHAANIYYNSDWEEIGIDKYPQLVVGNPLASYGVLGSRTFKSFDENYFFVFSLISYPQQDIDFPYGNVLIQKWDIDRNLMWERVISDPIVHNRLFFTSLIETDEEIILAGYVWSDFDIAGTRDFAIMTLDLDGCYNGDCSDTIYLNGPPTSTFDLQEDTNIELFPNPAFDHLHVRSKASLNSIVVYDMDGNIKVEEVLSESSTHTIVLSALPRGMYIVRVVSGEGIQLRKVMKL